MPASSASVTEIASGALLTGFDYAVIAIIVLSALRGAWRGLISELFALVGWIVAIIIGARYAGQVAQLVPANWPGGQLTQWIIGFAVVAVAVVVVAGVANALLSRLTQASGLQSVDRSLGLLFGLARGVLLVMILFVAAKFTELPRYPLWRDALLRPYVEQGVAMVKPFLPVPLQSLVRD